MSTRIRTSARSKSARSQLEPLLQLTVVRLACCHDRRVPRTPPGRSIPGRGPRTVAAPRRRRAAQIGRHRCRGRRRRGRARHRAPGRDPHPPAVHRRALRFRRADGRRGSPRLPAVRTGRPPGGHLRGRLGRTPAPRAHRPAPRQRDRPRRSGERRHLPLADRRGRRRAGRGAVRGAAGRLPGPGRRRTGRRRRLRGGRRGVAAPLHRGGCAPRRGVRQSRRRPAGPAGPHGRRQRAAHPPRRGRRAGRALRRGRAGRAGPGRGRAAVPRGRRLDGRGARRLAGHRRRLSAGADRGRAWTSTRPAGSWSSATPPRPTSS